MQSIDIHWPHERCIATSRTQCTYTFYGRCVVVIMAVRGSAYRPRSGYSMRRGDKRHTECRNRAAYTTHANVFPYVCITDDVAVVDGVRAFVRSCSAAGVCGEISVLVDGSPTQRSNASAATTSDVKKSYRKTKTETQTYNETCDDRSRGSFWNNSWVRRWSSTGKRVPICCLCVARSPEIFFIFVISCTSIEHCLACILSVCITIEANTYKYIYIYFSVLAIVMNTYQRSSKQ